MYWSWLLALSLKTALRFHDPETAQKLQEVLTLIMNRDNSVVELYQHDSTFTPWQSDLLKAERPFSWGAAFVLDAVSGLN